MRRLNVEITEEEYRRLTGFPYGARRTIIRALLLEVDRLVQENGYDSVTAAALTLRLRVEQRKESK